MYLLAIDVVNILIKVAQFLLGLSFLVAIHELGHMLTAKWFGMRVEKYAIGFPPKIIGKQIGETEYMIGAVPLGGFVKISGMVDESLDTNMLNEPPKPYEFRAKPAWQRLIVMLGGVIVNVLAGIILFILIFYIYGEKYLPAKEVKYGVEVSEAGEQMGFRDGDKIIKVNGKVIDEFDEIYNPNLLMDNGTYYTVERNGQLVDVKLPANTIDLLSAKKKGAAQTSFIEPRAPFMIAKVEKGSAADKVGIQKGDRIIEAAGRSIHYYQELQAVLLENAGKKTPLVIEREGKTITLTPTLGSIEEKANKGILGILPQFLFKNGTHEYSLAQSIPLGTQKAFNIVILNIKGFAKIFRGEASLSNSLGGPVTIANLFGGPWEDFWSIVAMLSMVLAFMNLLPIPALDGGHVMFLTYEMITGQKPSDKFLENAQKVGMVLLLGLMVFAFGNDIYKLFT
jgi:regulator of sigma E protease